MVLAEKGSVVSLLEDAKCFVSSPVYVLKLKTDKGIFYAKIINNYERPLEALALAIEEGSYFKLKKKYSDRFKDSKIGYLNSDEILLE